MTPEGPRKLAKVVKAKPGVIVKPGNKKSKAKINPAIESVVVVADEVETPAPATPPVVYASTFNVVFSIPSGKIKSSVDAVLEDQQAIMLVYPNEDSISYEPETGSKFTLITPDKREHRVMALGLKFEWYNSRQQILVFMKLIEE